MKSTGIRIQGEVGMNARAAERAAKLAADNMELAAKGECPLDKIMDAVRAAGEACGLGRAVPSVRELLDSVPATSAASSESNRRRAHALFIRFLGAKAEERVDAVTGEDCRAFVLAQFRQASPRTVEIFRVYLKMAFDKGVRDRVIYGNPWDGVSVAKLAKGAGVSMVSQRREAFTAEEIKRMITDFPAPWNEMVAVAYFCNGLRISDVCLMRWSGVDFGRGVIFLREKKTGKEREILLRDDLRSLLERRQKAALPGDEYVFPSMAERYNHSPSYVSTQFTALLRAFGILPDDDGKPLAGNRHRVSRKSFHSIRHTVVSVARSDSRLTADVVREAVGHSSEEVERGYFSATAEQRAKVGEVLEEALRRV